MSEIVGNAEYWRTMAEQLREENRELRQSTILIETHNEILKAIRQSVEGWFIKETYDPDEWQDLLNLITEVE